MAIVWVTAFIDRPVGCFDDATAFWLAATATSKSPVRGVHGEFATLVPPDGDAFLRVQRVEEMSSSVHVDLHAEDVEESADRAEALGASATGRVAGHLLARSPAGLPFCVVRDGGERVRPAPVEGALVDQICIDVPADRYAAECDFWSALTGWTAAASAVRPEFTVLDRPVGMPIRLLLQRVADPAPSARAHLDIACTDRTATAATHERLGATAVAILDHWTVMRDPSGSEYCLTDRDPTTGTIPA